MAVADDAILDKSPTIDHRTIGGEAFIISAEDSRIHSLNDTASFIFDRCDGKTPLRAIVGALSEAFEVTPEVAWEDTRALVEELLSRGMLVIAS